MEGYDKISLSDYDIEIASYDIEIERKEEELKEIYRKEGESRYEFFVDGGLVGTIFIIPLFIWMITVEGIRVYGILGVLFCILVAILAVVGKRCHDNKIDRLEREIIELKEKKKQAEQKYAQYGKEMK